MIISLRFIVTYSIFKLYNTLFKLYLMYFSTSIYTQNVYPSFFEFFSPILYLVWF